MNYRVDINYTWCKRCGICYWICPTHAIVEGDLKYPKVENHKKCIGCMLCENGCPEMAIDVSPLERVKREA